MLRLTKIFHFEMAHAIYGYRGACSSIHGHSYELHVTVASTTETDDPIPGCGILMDFKALKAIVKTCVIEPLDHKLLLSGNFLSKTPTLVSHQNLVTWPVEPTAENILLFIKKALHDKLPAGVILSNLKLYETKDSYAEWQCR
jgi:6-pyruvoyltetrahydropterin/6-carboxytetrahydropterin synthase